MASSRKHCLWYCIRRDFQAALLNDPAAHGPWAKIEVALTYPGFHAILIHRFNHVLYRMGIPFIPHVISMLNRFLTGVEIHEAAKIGPGFFIDHGMGVVIGETAEVGENCMLFQGVTLGGTGKEQTAKRHPTLLDGVVIGAGAKILGNITIGQNSYVGGNSVVLADVPDNATIVGVPGRVVKRDGKRIKPSPISHPLDHKIPDPVVDRFRELEDRLETLERELSKARREVSDKERELERERRQHAGF